MDKIKRLIKTNIPGVEDKIRKVAEELGFKDLGAINEAEAELIADEIMKNNGELAVTEASKPGIVTKTNGNGKKPKALEIKSVNPGMKEVIKGSVDGTEKIFQTVDTFYNQLEGDRAKQIIERAKAVNSNILSSVIEELQGEAQNTDSFCSELEEILRATYSGI